MSVITLALDEKTLEAARRYARRHQVTLDALVRELLVEAVMVDRQTAVAEMFRLMDAHPGNSDERRWDRDELNTR
jgi:hypothetical protein